jgi:hypothetical protein
LLGTGPANNQPTGIAATAGVHQIAFTGGTPAYKDFVHADRLCAEANVSMDSYSVITRGDSLLSRAGLRKPISSPDITDDRCFAGACIA